MPRSPLKTNQNPKKMIRLLIILVHLIKIIIDLLL